MCRFLPITSFALLTACVSAPGPQREAHPGPATDRSAVSELERRIPRLMDEGLVPGLAVGLIEGAEPVWVRGFGVKHTETREPVTPATVFEAASLSKPVFAYAVLKLADRGVLDLDAPLSRYLPEPLVADDERLHRITARTVLTHTAGLPNWRPRGEPLRIHFTPGERFSYSGEGFVYLQQAVERLAERPLDNLMRETVFDPLGMRNSSYVWREAYDTLKAFGHGAAGEVTGRGRSLQPNAAASLETTAADYARFVAAVMRGEGLAEETARAMLSPQVWVNAGCAVCVGREPGPVSTDLAWGLGWAIEVTGGDTLFWHWGDNGDMKAFVVGSRATGDGVVLFANGANGLAIAPEIVRTALGGEHPAFTWLDYELYTAPSRRVLREVLARGESALADAGDLSGSDFARLGSRLLAAGRAREAAAAFHRAIESDSASTAAHRGLADAYRRLGERSLAAQHYRRATKLDPRDGEAAQLLAILEAPGVVLSEERLEAYTGAYRAPIGLLTVSRRGNRLFARLDESSANELLPRSEERFYVEGIGADVVFVSGADGSVSHLLLLLGGEEIRADRIR
jgi:CubicO group peptidase (beta-lactamase class C family)